MSTVLWANVLEGGNVRSDQVDRYALYKHGEKLDSITRSLGLPSFLGICDTTDLRFNTSDDELPPGVESTSEVMAREGVWMDAASAAGYLGKILAHVREQKTRFGLLSNQHDEVVQELTEVSEFVAQHAGAAEKFNFSVVM